jgi:dihydrofolate reductase
MVVWGSLTVVQSLAEATLVDEYQLWVLPLVVGGGRPLFAEGVGPITMDLLEAKPTGQRCHPSFAASRADHLRRR